MGFERIKISDRRNYGVDLLRLYAMFLIVILHVLGQGGILGSISGARKVAAWLPETFAYCAVDCYALISGYVSYTERDKPVAFHKYLNLWLQVVFYSFGITLIFYFAKPGSVDSETLVRSALPVATKHYWYFSAYTALFFLIPILNRLIRIHSEQELGRTVLTLALLFSGFATFARGMDSDPFLLIGGYSMAWLVILYIMGAWMKRCRIPERFRSTHALLTVVLCGLISWGAKYLLPDVLKTPVLISFISPTSLLAAMAYLVLFARMKLSVPAKRCIAILSPAAFGIYLIHTQKTVWDILLKDAFVPTAKASMPMLFLWIFLLAAGVFAVCLLIEELRILLFRLLRIEQATLRLENLISKRIRTKQPN